MRESIAKILKYLAWRLFWIILIMNAASIFIQLKNDLIIRQLPLEVDKNRILAVQDTSLAELLTGKILTRVDTLDLRRQVRQVAPVGLSFGIPTARSGIIGLDLNTEDNLQLRENLQDKTRVEIGYLDTSSGEEQSILIPTREKTNISLLASLSLYLLFLIFLLFNTVILLKYGQQEENILIVFFLLILAIPENLPLYPYLNCLLFLGSAMIGALFYHFILSKVYPFRKIAALYWSAAALAIFCCLLLIIFGLDGGMLLYIWSFYWILVAFRLLWKEYRRTGSIDLKRLINAFRGILFSIIGIILIVFFALILSLLTAELPSSGIYAVGTIMITVLLIGSIIFFVIGILWFLGSFTWSLLTGTALDVKIRSTLIYTMIGVIFVTLFGLLDYTLGELLQSLFGNFIGSEFIAGIPAAIGLLIFFNPVRNRVEAIVDKKLNTSDLDFLEKTDSFTRNISDEGVIEGFEEYICENLIHRLPINKVALVAYDPALDKFRFNEVRGSDIIENSCVQDIHDILAQPEIYKSYIVNENIQDISSFNLVLPVLYEEDQRWFLALGKKLDGSVYTRKDEEAFQNLADKIRLSLKFILTYDQLISQKFQKELEDKDKIIRELRNQITRLQKMNPETSSADR
ncbi:MAG: hypothetical protein JW784_03260 [Candidatus Cloacimonetes bacterium]|nr:hypothetical protein [Candidatus Cloacimonadota bacterium]